MKKLSLLFMACLTGFAVLATTWTITVADFSFTPSTSPNVHIGDTVKFVWSSGTHNTTSEVIPSGAASWASPMTSSNTTFSYVPTVAGNYSYECTIHVTMGMVGSFTVVSSSGMEQVSAPAFTVSPNPASDILHIQSESASPVSVALYDITGQKVIDATVSASQSDIDVSKLSAGNYILKASLNGAVSSKQITITR